MFKVSDYICVLIYAVVQFRKDSQNMAMTNLSNMHIAQKHTSTIEWVLKGIGTQRTFSTIKSINGNPVYW